MTHSLIWFRNDLRVTDNPALHHAMAASKPVTAVYIDCPRQNQIHKQSSFQADFIQRNLESLAWSLDSIGITLHRLKCADFKAVPAMLERFCQQQGIDKIFANREIPINERLRDKAVKERLSIPMQLFNGDCVIKHGSVLNVSNSMFRVFTPFSKAWLRKLRHEGYATLPAPEGIRFLNDSKDDNWPAGESAAFKRLDQFCQQAMMDYSQHRDFPAMDSTSHLSAYLAVGVLSPAQCLQAIEQTLGYLPMSPGEKGFTWLNELIWREFYRHLMIEFPDLSKNQPFKPETTDLEWIDDEDLFGSWCDGTTGYPIVDAAMRCLNQTGWMHNRLRMIVASFLTKDLQIHWRKGEDYFMSHLIDADLAANNGGWQWAASTGADSAPYFRIFNPTTQGEKFDREGDFIRRWVPELSAVPSRYMHQPRPWLDQHDGQNSYPGPIVDHKLARQQTLARFQRLKQQQLSA